MNKLIKILWLVEFTLVMLLISGIVPVSFSYIFLLVLIVGILKLSDIDALQLYILSIPIFVALPASSLSDAMSVWRIALALFTLKVVVERFNVLTILSEHDLNFSGRVQKLHEEFKIFAGEIRSSNYYGVVWPTLLFMGIGLFSLLFAQSIGAGIKKIIFISSIFLIFGIIQFAAKSKDDLMKVVRSVFISAVFILLVGYFQFIVTFFVNLSDFWGIWDAGVINAFYGAKMQVLLSYSNTWFSYYNPPEVIPPTLRMFSVMPDSHSFSMLMILFAPLALFYFYSSERKFEKAKYFLVFSMMLLAIWFSGSRGAWVGWLGAVATALYFYLRSGFWEKFKFLKKERYAGNKKIYKTVLASVLLFAVLFPVSDFVLTANQNSQLIREGKEAGMANLALLKRTLSISDMDETSNKGRREIWYDSAVSIINHPITGIGIGNFPIVLGEKVSTSKMGSSAHNIYLDVAVEMGVLGLLAFLVLLAKICEKLLRLTREFKEEKFRLLAFSVLVYLMWIFTYGFFDVVIFNDKVLMFVVIVLGVVYKLDDLEEKEMVES